MCCTSGWPIPVEGTGVAAIDETIARKVIPLQVAPWIVPDAAAPADVAGVLALRPNGHCVFFEAGGPGCSIHDVKPAPCVHFPYVCLIDPRGVRVALSHYCPTAASLLFEHTGPIAIVEGPRPVPEGHALEGLDARESLPPTFAPAVASGATAGKPRLLSWPEFSDWERREVSEARIDVLQPDDVERFDRARAAVPPPWGWPPAPRDLEAAWWGAVAPAWPRFDDVLRRYAAAKVFASWAAYQGDGLEAVRELARTAAAVLRIECARQCLDTGGALDRELLTEAIRQTDLLLVHYADPHLLAAPRI
jgi:Fe-S-cluster containining protein